MLRLLFLNYIYLKQVKRVIGEFSQSTDGPVFIAIAGIHGNELAGVSALYRLFQQLSFMQPKFNGTFIGIAGNLRAINAGKRYISIDLNRQWYAEKVNYLERAPKYLLQVSEDVEQKELITLLKRLLRRYKKENINLLDLHTTSSEGGAFCIANADSRAQDLAKSLHVPVIVGLEKVIIGTTMNYFTSLDLPAFGFEAGEHYDWQSVIRMEAAIWKCLVKLGCINQKDVPLYDYYDDVLMQLSLKNNKVAHKIADKLDTNKVLELCYRHVIMPDQNFEMKPNYLNFQPIEKGEVLANDVNGPIKSPLNGMMLMPLYQKQGNDGFFIVRPT